MTTDIWTTLLAGIGTFGFFGGIALLMWIDQKGKARERDLVHTERLKSLELGQALPDAEVARANAEASRAWALALTTTLVPLGLFGTAVGATAMVFASAGPSSHTALVSAIWGTVGVVSLVTVSIGLSAGQKRRERAASSETTAAPTLARRPAPDAIRAADAPSNAIG